MHPVEGGENVNVKRRRMVTEQREVQSVDTLGAEGRVDLNHTDSIEEEAAVIMRRRCQQGEDDDDGSGGEDEQGVP